MYYRCEGIIIIIIIDITLRSVVVVLQCCRCDVGLQNPTELDPRLISPVLAKIFCCMPEDRKRQLWCGVKHDLQVSDSDIALVWLHHRLIAVVLDFVSVSAMRACVQVRVHACSCMCVLVHVCVLVRTCVGLIAIELFAVVRPFCEVKRLEMMLFGRCECYC